MSDHCLSFVSTLAVLASAPYYLKVEKNINTFKNFVLIGMKTNPCISRYAAVINLISFMYSFLDLKNIYINSRYIYIYIYNNIKFNKLLVCKQSLLWNCLLHRFFGDFLHWKSGFFHSIGYHFSAYRWYVDSS